MFSPLDPEPIKASLSQKQTQDEEEDDEENYMEEFMNIENREKDSVEMTITDNLNTFINSKFKTTIEYCENVCYKSNAVSNLIHCNTKLSKIRQNRYYFG